jgi:hypothetical protein
VGITVTGIIDPDSPAVLSFGGLPASAYAAGGTAITIHLKDINNNLVTPDSGSWYVEMAGPQNHIFTGLPSSYILPALTPGFYNVNVIATVGGIAYSGSFGLPVVPEP